MIRPRKNGANIQRLAKMADSMVRSKLLVWFLDVMLIAQGLGKSKKNGDGVPT
jgi:hypothetical protein